jgi:hypothetical protein
MAQDLLCSTVQTTPTGATTMPNPFRIQQNAEAVRAMVRAARDAKSYAVRVMASADLAPRWTDDTQPRTDRPAIFYLYKLGAPCPHIVTRPATR